MIFAILLYTLVEISLELEFEKLSDPRIRGTVTSIGWFFCSIFASVSLMFLGFVSKIASTKTAMIVICFVSLLMVLFLHKKINDTK